MVEQVPVEDDIEEVLAKYKDHSACRGYYLPFGVPLASLPQLESMFPCK